MKFILICLLFGGAVAIPTSHLRIPSKSETRISRSLTSCSGEGRWRSDCNWCRCSEGLSLCTRRGCPPSIREQLESEPECKGVVIFKRDCNTCNCVNGRAVCTTKYCGPVALPSEISVSVRRVVPEPECTNGSRWRRDCNWCSCDEITGLGKCTKKGCPPEPTEQQQDEPECIGTSSWRKDCNWCNCVDGVGICTLKACDVDEPQTPPKDIVVSQETVNPDATNSEISCTAGSRWREECNWCNCNHLGVRVCTLMLCAPGIMEDMKTEPECEGASEWKRDCNWCNCVEGRAICTLKACRPDEPQTPPKDIVVSQEAVNSEASNREIYCTAGSRWREECNWCNCNQLGLSICTLMLCAPDISEDIETEPECEGTSEWKRDCNWCNCVEGRAICTLKACRPDLNPPQQIRVEEQSIVISDSSDAEAVCTIGSRWREDCNWCICLEMGEALCSQSSCLESVPSEEPECEGTSRWKKDCNWCNCVDGRAICAAKHCTPDTVKPNEGICTNGSRWRQDCNWCQCIDGRAACTEKACPDTVPLEEPECEGISRWKKDCNLCNCVDGRAICTTKHCTPDTVKSSEEVCTNGSRWRQDCNWCQCTDNGVACTTNDCQDTVPSDEPECEGISNWRKECNWCKCVDGRAICTTKHCTPELREEGKVDLTFKRRECNAIASWKEKCNWCHCDKKGLRVCTKVGCPADYEHPVGEPQCKEGSRWRKECNWCHCENGTIICREQDCSIIRVDGLNKTAPITDDNCTNGESWQDDCNTCTCSDGIVSCTLEACVDPTFETVEAEPQCTEGSSWSEDCNRCRCSDGLRICTKRLCPGDVPKRCRLPPINPEAPSCMGLQRKWTYDSADTTCKEIIYGGCGGTENLFDSEAECSTVCDPVLQSPLGSGSSEDSQRDGKALVKDQKKCLLPVEQGPCFGAMPRFYYNKVTGTCESFTYGGCQGNANRFHTFEDCIQACEGVSPPTGNK